MTTDNRRLLGSRWKQREVRGRALEKAVARWLASFRRYKLRQAREMIEGRFSKQTQDEFFENKLAEILTLYGVRELGDSVNAAAGDYIVEPQAVTAATEGKGTNIKVFTEYRNGVLSRVRDIIDDTSRAVNAQVNEMIQEAVAEVPQPSVGALAQRLRDEVFEGRFVFSDRRATVIARTELTQAVNTGTFEGYRATGVKRVRWLAFRDGKSGDRRHDRMHNKIINVGEYFVTPLGNRMRYPGDPSAPIKETINCRCTVAAVI